MVGLLWMESGEMSVLNEVMPWPLGVTQEGSEMPCVVGKILGRWGSLNESIFSKNCKESNNYAFLSLWP